jgi:hypothetical protein
MDPKRDGAPALLALAARGGAAMRCPPADPPGPAFPPIDEHIVKPEVTRDEVLRGRKLIAQPALHPHADRHADLDFVIRSHVRTDYVTAIDLLTRVASGSDFATDLSIRRAGIDRATDQRYLEEISFEIVNEQSVRDARDKAEDLCARGVRRVIVIFVKKGEVAEWSRERGDFEAFDSNGALEDPCLVKPIPVRALLDAIEAENEAARGLRAKGNPVLRAIEDESRREGRDEGRRAIVMRQLRARFGELSAATIMRVEAARSDTLDVWAERLLSARSIEDVFSG